MKKKTVVPSVSIVFVLILMGLGFTSCNKDNDESREVIITVASVTRIPYLSYGGSDFYFIKEEDQKDWTGLSWIEGFDYKEGHEYILRIRQEKYPDWELVMDRPAYRYILLEILSDEEKESEEIPDQYLMARIASKKSESDSYYVLLGGDWEEIEDITEFEYEEGYEYTILISARFLGQNAQPRYAYSCQEILNKEEKVSERLPEK